MSAFDAPSSYTLDGIAYAPAGLFNASLNGVISSNGVQLYSGSMSSTVALPSVLNVAGLTSNGGVSSVSSVTGSFLGAPVAPVLAFPPPSSGGAQATASLSTIGYFGGTITFSGTMSGYAVNDVVTFSDGNCGTPISLKVTAVTSGVPTALGSNSVVGSCPLSESTLTSISTTDSGSGTGLKVNGQSLMWRPLTVAVTGSGAGYGTAPTIAISRGTISATVSLGTSILPLGTAGTTGTPIQNLGAFVDGSAPSAVVLTTSGYTVPVNTSLVRFKPIGTVATSTLTLPTAYADGQILNLDLYGYNVTALTFSPSVTGFTNASVWTANTNHVLRWDASGSVWFLEK